MSDDPTMSPTPPVKIAMIGTGTGDGGLAPQSHITAKTPGHIPDLIVKVVSPLVAILIRFVNLFGTVLVALITAGLTPDGAQILMPTGQFVDLVQRSASLALTAAAFGFIKDLVTIFTGLERKFPLSTGSV